MQSQPLRAWELGLTTSRKVPSPESQVWHGCLHSNTFWRWSWGLVLRFRLSKKLDPTLNKRVSYSWWYIDILGLKCHTMTLRFFKEMAYSNVKCHFVYIMMTQIHTWASSHGFQVLSPTSVEVNPCNPSCWEHGSWDLPLHTESKVQNPKYDMDVYVVTLFRGEIEDLRWDLGRPKVRPNSQHKPQVFFA